MQVTILSGSIVRVWGVLEQVLQRHEHELNKADRSMRIIRVEMATTAHPEQPPLVGVRYKHTLLPEVGPVVVYLGSACCVFIGHCVMKRMK